MIESHEALEHFGEELKEKLKNTLDVIDNKEKLEKLYKL